MSSRIFISAAHKSSGKTTVSIGLCAALKQRGNTVQSFKKGPDYIDPYWLAQATDRDCYNLDFYTMERDEILFLMQDKSQDADIALIEGNKGLYDGLDLDGSNSNAALATLTKTPVLLVLNARGMTRGIAPLILGYQAFDKNVSIKGVILNRLGGSRHENKLRNVIEHYTDVEVVGAIHNDKRFDIEERHLGLVPGHEDPFCTQKINLLADAVSEQVNLDTVLSIAKQVPELPSANVSAREKINIQPSPQVKDIKLGLIRCSAFGFYYPDDLQALEMAGAKIIEIDPCHQTELPDIDALFIGGGFPETHMQELEANESLRGAIKLAIDNDLPTYAECGGLMYLARSIQWTQNNHSETRQMVGIIDTDIIMEKTPQGRGYVQLQETENSLWPKPESWTADKVINAHEFHYSRFSHNNDESKHNNIRKNADKNVQFAFNVKRGTGINGKSDGYIYKNLLANYSHQRNTWNNPWAQRFIDFCRTCKSQNTKN
ncbi:Protein similar to cobyrinic acid a,c-diamide synthetase clustered with dissimilatory sulfite reductase [hydrothermal vent metagenome]|uniref:Protein similar to cobyrinic acid a,c-diamide synthetase clustered with dissimilatory sulfite reductase n=1 Tax=hydrothermal vent metagenome TaxID=652676 RepID=A0A3B0X906_9ZZZZ